MPSESEFTAASPRNSLDKTSLIESHSSESRIRRRQKIATERLSTSNTMVEPIATVVNNSNDLLQSTDELEVRKRCPIEKLTYYFEQHEIDDEEDYHHVQIKNEFTSTSNSSPATIGANRKQEETNTMVS